MKIDLQKTPGVGKKMEEHLIRVRYPNIAALKGQDSEDVYAKDCLAQGVSVSRCALCSYRQAIHFVDNDGKLPPHKRNW